MVDSEKYVSAVVVARREVASDLWIIRVRPEIDIAFRPGQYATIGLACTGHVIERPYSICSAPEEDELELFIERVPGGEVSTPLYEVVVGGEILVRRRTKGLFLRDAPLAGCRHLGVATVTGIAPFVSWLRMLAQRARAGRWVPEPVTILQGASHSREFGYSTELHGLAEELDWFTYIPTVSRPWADEEWRGELGRVEDVLRKHADGHQIGPRDSAVFLCGHPSMIRNARAVMRRRGLDDRHIGEEQYWPD